MKKVLIITPTLSVSGGRERVMSNFSTYLHDKMAIRFLTLNGIKDSYYHIPSSVEIDTLDTFYQKSDKKGSSKFNYLLDILSIRRYILSNNTYKVIISTDVYITIFLYFALLGTKRVVISNEHLPFNNVYRSNLLHRIRNFIFPKIVDITVSLTEKDKVHYEAIGCKNCIVIPNALTFANPIKSIDNKQVILAVGRLTKQKGFDILIDSVRNVFDHHPSWTLIIYGDGPERESLLSKISLYKLENNVFIKPPTENIADAYLNASCYVLSSRYEAFPMVLIEAMSYGLACIAFDCETGPSEIILSNVDGILVPQGETEALGDAIRNIIENEHLRQKIANNAFSNIKRLNPEVIFKKWFDIINQID